jgi:tRNA U38,U39,U40 pseudouridine synthase TruA
MVYVQIKLAQGTLEADRFSQALAQPQEQSMFQGLAPSQGLSLVEVRYPPQTKENDE